MIHSICMTCGVQHAAAAQPPDHCAICRDDRQYIGPHGQQWTTNNDLARTHKNRIETVAPGLTGIGTDPKFAIGQRALLVQNPAGNVLWDCVSLLDDATLAAVRGLGGLAAIAVSHPHLVGSVVDWSRAFGGVPIYWHASNREWVMRPDPAYVFWDQETLSLGNGLTLVRCGGHFPGSTVLHWTDGAAGRGALLTGDTMQVVSDRRYVSFMYSYPNLIPVNAHTVDRIVRAVEPFDFEILYGGWWDSIVGSDAKNAVHRSAQRYIEHTRI